MTAVLFLLLLLASPVLPQCNWTPRYSGQFRATAYDVAVDADGMLWVATGYGVQLFEDASTPTLVSSIAIPGSTRVVRPSANGIAYAGSGTRLYVLRRTADRKLEVVRIIDTGATVNDIAIVTPYLFVATSNGILHYDLFDPTKPFRTTITLPVTANNVTSLAVLGNKLYAADGDSTVEIFSLVNPGLPQHTGTLESLPQSSSVSAMANGIIFVSDPFGQNTDVFQNETRLGRAPVGGNSAASAGGSAYFLAGPNRTLRAYDLTTLGRVGVLYEAQLAPTEGTDNVIHQIVRAGNKLYVAAGDIGLVTFDITSLTARPYPLVSYAATARTSVLMAGNKAYFTDAAGSVTEFLADAAGIALTPVRTWSDAAGARLQDSDGSALLTSAGATAAVWRLDTTTPTQTFGATFRANIRSAVLRGDTIVALLVDQTVWTASAVAGPQQVAVPAPVSAMARAGNALAFADLSDSANTTILYYPNSLTDAPQRITFAGISASNIALDATRVAVFTFRGITVHELATGAETTLPSSNAFIPKQLLFSGSDLLVLGDRKLQVWTNARTLARELPLPSDAVAMSASSPLVAVAASQATIALRSDRSLPQGSGGFANDYPTNLLLAGDRLYLVARDRISIYSTAAGDAPQFAGAVRVPGLVDVAATPAGFFTLAGNGTVSAWSAAGTLLRQTQIDEGSDAQVRTIAAAGNAIWVSVSKGFSTGQSQKKTLVLDPLSLVVTSSMNGGVTDVVTSGDRAYALFDLPNETRVYDIRDPLHPAPLAAVVSQAGAMGIGVSENSVYVVAEKVYALNATTLASTGQFLSNIPSNDARLAIDGRCAIVTGRGPNPEQYTLPSWTPAAPVEVPSTVRAVAVENGRAYLLTDHSLEVWSSRPQTPQKRRSVW
ncbi:MAG TPA: hypothetical protein VF824_13450 [Thermoanaerobaculia bacterium]